MSIQTRSLLGVAAAAVALLTVRYLEHGERYAFGRPGLVDAAVETLLWVMAATHAVIAGIMWMQRRRWLPSDAAMFRFISAKVLLWVTVGANYVAAGRGVLLDIAVLYVLIAATTLDLDVRLFRRYVAASADEREPPWDRTTERRIGPPDRREGIGP